MTLRSKVLKAASFAMKIHKGQENEFGKDYFSRHVLPVAEIIEMVTEDKDVIAAAYLRNTIEDTDTTYEELLEEFGKRVADLVMEINQEGDTLQKESMMIRYADKLNILSQMDI